MVQVLVTVPCGEAVRESWEDKFREVYQFTYKKVNELKAEINEIDKTEIEEAEINKAEIIIGEPPIELLSATKKLKWLQTTSAGVDMYTGRAEFPEGVMLTNATGVYGKIISEYVLGAILMRYRRFSEYLENQKEHLWESKGAERSLEGKRVLILGTGDIGKNIARRLQAFDAYVIGLKRTLCESVEYFHEVDTLDHIERHLQKADIVICCLPGTDATRGILNYEKLVLMKEDAMLVNVGRGNLIVTNDLLQILDEGRLSDVILDVEETEPLPAESSLWEEKRIFITPHISGKGLGYAPETEEKVWQLCTENLERFAEGKALKNQVDQKLGY